MAQVTQNNVNHALTAKVIQGLADREDFVGLRIAPALGQKSLKTNYPVIKLAEGEMLRSNMERRVPGSSFKKMSAKIDLDDSTVEGDGIDIPIPLEIYMDSMNSGLDALAVYAEEGMLNALRLHEARVAAISQGSDFTAANSSTAYTSANLTSMVPSQDIQDAVRRVKKQAEKANHIAIPAEVWDLIRFSDDLRSFIAGSINPGAAVTAENLQKAFADQGIQRVDICEAYVNEGKKNKVDVQPIWANTHIFVGASDATSGGGDSLGSSKTMRSAIKTFFWEQIFSGPFVVKTFYDETGTESYIIRTWGYTNEKVVNARAGTRITTQYA